MAMNISEWHVQQFNGEDFSNWAFRMKSILREKQVLQAIESEDFSKKAENKVAEAKAQAIIIAGVCNSHLEYIKSQNSAYGMFKTLEDNFKSRGTRSRLFLRRLLNEIKYDERNPLAEHIIKLEDYFSRLKDAEGEISEDDKINYLLLSMPRSYDGIVTALETQPALKWDQVKNSLLGEEEKKKKFQNAKESVESAFLCFNCGQPGHKRYQCREPQQYRGNCRSRGPSRGRGMGKERGSSSRGRSTSRRGRGRGSTYCAEEEDSSYQNRVAFFTNSESPKIKGNERYNNCDIVWYVDSGCSDHFVANSEVLLGYKKLKVPKRICAAKSGVTLEATGVGYIKVITHVNGVSIPGVFKSVYHVPEVRKNLLSVSQLEEKGFKVVFYNGKVEAFLNNKLIFCGSKNGTLFSVSMSIDRSATAYYGKTIKYDNSSGEIDLWHRRLGHLSFKNLDILVKGDLVNGLDSLKNNHFQNFSCESCILGKMSIQPYNGTRLKATKPLELIHSDVCGPITPVSWDGSEYFVSFIDDFTHFTVVFLIKNKSEVYEKFCEYYNYATKHFNKNILRLRCDNGGEYTSNSMKNFCKKKGIKVEYTVPYNPQMNGVSERMNRTLVDKARTLLLESKLPKDMWGEAIYCSAYISNRSPTASKEKTPSEMWEGCKPNLCNLRVFGCTAYKHVPKETRRKLDPKSQKLIMVGYAPGGGWRLWDPQSRKLILGRNVIFDERKVGERRVVRIPIDSEEVNFEDKDGKSEDSSPKRIEELNNEISDSSCGSLPVVEGASSASEEGVCNKEVETGNKRTRKLPVWQKDYDMNMDDEDAMFALLSQGYDLPKSYEEIQKRDDREDWMAAIREELSVLEESETWEVVPLPKDAKPIDTKWVFADKKLNDGSTIKKARLVVRGFQQKEKFTEIYSPVVKMQTLRVLLSIAAKRKYEIHQMDVKGAFLYGKINENVYLKTPEGVNVPKKSKVSRY